MCAVRTEKHSHKLISECDPSEAVRQLYDNRCNKSSRFQTTRSLWKIVREKMRKNQRWEIMAGDGWERFLVSFVRFLIKKRQQ